MVLLTSVPRLLEGVVPRDQFLALHELLLQIRDGLLQLRDEIMVQSPPLGVRRGLRRQCSHVKLSLVLGQLLLDLDELGAAAGLLLLS